MQVDISRQPGGYVATTPDGRVVGRLDTLDDAGRPDVRLLVHAEVSPQFEGRGVAGSLVRAAVGDLRAEGLRLARAPICSFVAAWLARHPDEQDLYADA